IQLPQWPNRIPNGGQLLRRLAASRVIIRGESPIGKQQLVDRDVRMAFRPIWALGRPVGPPPFGDQAGVLLVASRRTVGAEVMVPAIDRYDGAVSRLVETVRGGRERYSAWHGRLQKPAKTVHVPFYSDLFAALPDAGRYAKTAFGENLREVHPTGL